MKRWLLLAGLLGCVAPFETGEATDKLAVIIEGGSDSPAESETDAQAVQEASALDSMSIESSPFEGSFDATPDAPTSTKLCYSAASCGTPSPNGSTCDGTAPIKACPKNPDPYNQLFVFCQAGCEPCDCATCDWTYSCNE